MSRIPIDLDDLHHRRYHDRLVEVAVGLFDTAPNDTAPNDTPDDPAAWSAVIVVAGLACDAAAAYALRCVLEADGRRTTPRLTNRQTRGVRDLLRSKKTVNLKPKAQRAWWELLTGDRLTRWPDWIRYVRCVDRRNSVLREGALPSGRRPARADAVEALAVTKSLGAHLERVLSAEPLLRDRA